jgi:uncharacterized protein YaaN involved in tellurite resistance
LTVYKQYELKEYKNLLYKFRKEKELEEIFFNLDEECKNFFNPDIKKDQSNNKIFKYEIFKKVKNKIKEFLEKKKSIKGNRNI